MGNGRYKIMNMFPESDWKKLRALKPKALDRYCNRVLDRIQNRINAPQQNAHQKYLDIYRGIHDDNELLAVLFDDWRRSNASLMFLGWVNHGLVTEDEFDAFSDETKALANLLDDGFSFYQPEER